MSEVKEISVQDLVDSTRFGAIKRLVLGICFATAVVDGVDNQVIGFSAPVIASALHIPLSTFGAIFSAGTMGGLIGAASLGFIADKIGRQKTLLMCTLTFAIFTLATPLASSASELIVLRLFAGLGLGGAMPVYITLVSEYSPKHRRALSISVLWCGYPAGGVVGGLTGSFIVPHLGWEAIFIFGGSLATVLFLLQWSLLPESLQFLANRDKSQGRLRTIAKRLAPNLDVEDIRFTNDSPASSKDKVGIAEIFKNGRAFITVFLTIAFFCTFMINNFFYLWAPALLETAGLTLSTTALVAALSNFAGIPAQVASGYLIDKTNPVKLLTVAYGAEALAIGALALSLHVPLFVAAAMLAIGFLSGPGTVGMLFLAASIYPSRMRSTGVGWATGFGRGGQVLGALATGELVALGLRPSWIFYGMCAPPLIALICVILLAVTMRHAPKSGEAEAARQVDFDMDRASKTHAR